MTGATGSTRTPKTKRKPPSVKKKMPDTGQLRRCMCEWLYPPRPYTHLDFCKKKDANG